ncbi:MAG: c-type cytochrome [Gammaproteobacteria bacterium]
MKKLFINIIVGLYVVTASSSFASEESHDSSHAAATPTKSGAEVAKQCVACHGEDGNSPTPNFPRIAGQHADYMFHSMMSYKNGDRKNAIMAGIVAALSEEEMKNVAAFFAGQDGLSVVNIDDESKH